MLKKFSIAGQVEGTPDLTGRLQCKGRAKQNLFRVKVEISVLVSCRVTIHVVRYLAWVATFRAPHTCLAEFSVEVWQNTMLPWVVLGLGFL